MAVYSHSPGRDLDRLQHNVRGGDLTALGPWSDWFEEQGQGELGEAVRALHGLLLRWLSVVGPGAAPAPQLPFDEWSENDLDATELSEGNRQMIIAAMTSPRVHRPGELTLDASGWLLAGWTRPFPYR